MPNSTTSRATVSQKGSLLLTSAIYKRKEDGIDFDFEPCEYNLDARYVIKCHHGGQCFKSKSFKYGHPYFRQFCV